MIELKDISVTFSSNTANAVKALDKINVAITADQLVIIAGSNGSGKSTLMNVIAGNIKPGAGKIYIENTDVTLLPDYKRSRYIARIFQNPLAGTAPDLTVLENFRIAALRSQTKKLKLGLNKKFEAEVASKVEILKMNLENKLHNKMSSLSGGQRQALTLIMSVMDHTRIILLDEPTASLDPRTSELIMENISRITSAYRLTGLLVTHNMKHIVKYGNRLLLMSSGKILMDLNEAEKKAITTTQLLSFFE